MPRSSLRPGPVSVEEMLDTFALQKLVMSYCHGIDRRDFALVRSLYHDDAIDDHGPMFCGGPDGLIAWAIAEQNVWAASAHVVSNMLFLIDGDHAEGEISLSVYHRSLDGAHQFIAHGRYTDQYKKRDGVWRFYRRALAEDWSEQGAAAKPGEHGIPAAQASEHDPVYQRLPMFLAQRNGVA